MIKIIQINIHYKVIKNYYKFIHLHQHLVQYMVIQLNVKIHILKQVLKILEN